MLYEFLPLNPDVCDLSGNLCFKEIMSETTRVLNCSCKADCSKVSYDYYIVRENLNPSMECSKTSENAFLIDYLKNYQSEMQMKPFFNMINIATGMSTADKIREDEVSKAAFLPLDFS